MFAMLYSAAKKFKGLLDTFSGASSAYSLRQLSADYTGGAIRVRRSTDDAEADIGFMRNGCLDEIALLNHCVTADIRALINNRMYFDGVDDSVSFPVQNFGTGDFEISATFVINEINKTLFAHSANRTLRLVSLQSLQSVTTLGGAAYTFTLDAPMSLGTPYEIALVRTGNIMSVKIDGVTQADTEAVVASNQWSVSLIGQRFQVDDNFKGVIYDVNINNVITFDGYGNTSADWEDQTGSNNGTVAGSPVLFTGQGFNGYVTKWYDQSGNSKDTFNTIAANQPRIFFDGAVQTSNGKPAIRFVGNADHHLRYTGGYLVELSANDASVMAVSEGLSTGSTYGNGYVMAEGDVISPYSSNFILKSITTSNFASVWVNGDSYGTTGTLAQNLYGFIKRGGAGTGSKQIQAFNDGAADEAEGSSTINAEMLTQTGIGTRGDFVDAHFDGYMQEIIIYKTDITNATFVDLSNAANNFYGVY